nr:unnamed protein product [Papilio xuthus]
MKLYRTLNCTMSSTFSEIEDSYKRLIKKVHPQRNTKVNERYYEINNAYEILKDSYKREFYDLYGEQAIPILQNREVGFAISRVFFKNNILAFILLSIICISNLMCRTGLRDDPWIRNHQRIRRIMGDPLMIGC